MILTAKRLKEILGYNPYTGIFVWKKLPHKSASNITIGSEAGAITNCGYRRVTIDSERHVMHRLAWLYVYGCWPHGSLDHKDGDKLNNSIFNLREADGRLNKANSKTHKNNFLGVKGVQKHECGKYRARIFINGRHVSLGLFDTPEAAHRAYCEAAKINFNEFARFS